MKWAPPGRTRPHHKGAQLATSTLQRWLLTTRFEAERQISITHDAPSSQLSDVLGHAKQMFNRIVHGLLVAC